METVRNHLGPLDMSVISEKDSRIENDHQISHRKIMSQAER